MIKTKKEIRQEIEQLGNLRAPKRKTKPAPLVLPESLIRHAFNNLELMRKFAWESEFFAAYISATFPPPTPNVSSVTDEGVSTETPPQNPEPALQTGIAGTGHEGEDTSSRDGEGDRGGEDMGLDMGLDISTEFETGEFISLLLGD